MVSKFEATKDVVQEVAESAATRVGNITNIITGAIKGVTREIGELVTDGIEMSEAAKRARQDSPE